MFNRYVKVGSDTGHKAALSLSFHLKNAVAIKGQSLVPLLFTKQCSTAVLLACLCAKQIDRISSDMQRQCLNLPRSIKHERKINACIDEPGVHFQNII